MPEEGGFTAPLEVVTKVAPDTSLVGVVAAYFHPMVPPAEPVTVTKYEVAAVSVSGATGVNVTGPSAQAPKEVPEVGDKSATFAPSEPLLSR